MKPPRNSVKPGKPPPPASSAPDSAAGNSATGSRTASTAVAGGGSMDVAAPLSDEWRSCAEKLRHSLVRGLPLLLQPHQVEVIWRAAATEELSKAAASKAQERQSASPRSSTPGTEAETVQPHLPLSGEGQNSEPVGSRGPSDLHQAAAAHTQRSVTGTVSAGKKGAGAVGRDSVAKVGKEGPNFSSFSKGPGPGAGGSGNAPPGWGNGSSKPRPESAASGYGAEGELGTAGPRLETEGVNFRETTCAILRLGSDGRRNPVVVDFHLFNLLFARQMKLSPAKTALFVSIMGAALAQLERDARVVSDVSPGSQLQVLQALFQMQTYNPLEAAQQPGAADTPSSVPSPATFPYFSPKEASNLMRFAKRTFISHCRLYLYCLKHPQSEVATTLHVFTFLPVAQPECSLPASESAPKTGGAS